MNDQLLLRILKHFYKKLPSLSSETLHLYFFLKKLEQVKLWIRYLDSRKPLKRNTFYPVKILK
ncbi:MAG: hypothetical protein CL589_01385 [Alteromonadaceae bacterium]|nr:hypothetical protein [Alteromonadaceae bacterium]